MLSRLSAASAMPRARTPEASGPWMFTANDQRLCGVSTPPTNQPMMPLSASSEPGLPKVPAALGIDVDEQGEITGLF